MRFSLYTIFPLGGDEYLPCCYYSSIPLKKKKIAKEKTPFVSMCIWRLIHAHTMQTFSFLNGIWVRPKVVLVAS